MGEEKEPLLEGALFNAELAGEAPPFRAHGESAAGLDLLVSMDEPASLMKRLKEIADEHPKTDKRWVGVSRLCERYAEYTEVIDRPEANRPHGSRLGGDLASGPDIHRPSGASHGKVGTD